MPMPDEARRVLIVEDNPGLARALAFTFRQAGYQVTACHDGAVAWEILQRDSFDAVLTDHEMPGMTGVELCRKLRASPQYADTPVVMVTGRELEFGMQSLHPELNLAAVYPKPFSPRALVKLMDGILPAAALAAVS
jgi:CheY-like chemotaxis protein